MTTVYITKADYILAITVENYVAEFYYTLDNLYKEEGFVEYIEIEIKEGIVDFDIDWSLICLN